MNASANKKPSPASRSWVSLLNGLQLHNADVGGLKALGSLFDIEFNGVAFVELTEAFADERFVMDEHVLAFGALDESVTLRTVEPLDSSLFHESFLSEIRVLCIRQKRFCTCCPLALKKSQPDEPCCD